MSSVSGNDSDYSDGDRDDGDDGALRILPSTIAALKSDPDPSSKVAVLTSFSDALAFTEYAEDLVNLPLDEIVPLLVELPGKGEGKSADVMLMSARVLTYLLDLVPRSAGVIVENGGVEMLCEPLKGIEYLDVAEQCLVALEKLSRRESVACLKGRVIMPVLSYMDFFDISIQRVAVSIVTNVCKEIPEDHVSAVIEAVPIMCNLLENEDQKLVESTAICLMGIVDNFGHSSELLDELCKQEVVKHTLNLISPDRRIAISEAIYTGMIGLLVRLATRSLVAVRTLYELNIISLLGCILRTRDLSRCTPHPHCEKISTDQIYVTLKLLNQLIPPVSHNEQDIQLVLNKKKIIINEPKFALQIAVDILPVLTQAVNSGANTCTCFGFASVVKNFVSFVPSVMLKELIQKANISRFLAGLVSQKDHHVLIPALNIVEIVMKKLPAEFLNSFIKDGIVYAIKALSKKEVCSLSQLEEEQSSHSRGGEDQTDANRPSCLCYAFDPCSQSSSAESKTCKLQRRTCHALAHRIMSNFFTESSISNIELSEDLGKLKAWCAEVENNGDSTLTNCAEVEDFLSQILDEVMTKLNGGGSMSTFEFIESGIVRFLTHYLTNGSCLHRDLDSDKKLEAYHVILMRLQRFTSMLLSSQSYQYLPLALLVQHLLNALSTLECFPIILSSACEPTSRNTDIPPKRLTMQPCLQVHLMKEEGETDLCDYNSVLTIDCSSSFDAIDEFLWPKINKKTTAIKGSRHRKKQSSQKEDPKKQVESSSPQSNEVDIKTKLIFLMDGRQLDRSITLYQAILQDKINEDPDIIINAKFWNEMHRVTFKREKEPQSRSSQMPIDTSQLSLLWNTTELSLQNLSIFSSILLDELPCKLERSNPSYDILFLLRILEGLNRFSSQLCSYERSNAFAEGRIKNFSDLKVITSSLPQAEFVNSKLNDKLEQQMHDRLAISTVTMPLWCTQLVVACPFLFSFESRWKYFHVNTFSSSRRQLQSSEEKRNIGIINDRSQSATLRRKRFKVHRDNILASAVKMMTWHSKRKALLEIEFSKEVGTGLGPTLEFYTLVSHELQKVGMGMWRGDHTSSIAKRRLKSSKVVRESDFVKAPFGLFPRPWSDSTDSSNGTDFSKVLKNFFLLGQLIARAIQDGRILDLPFSMAFYKLILEQDLNIYDVHSFDPELGRTLIEFQALAKRKRYLESPGVHFKDVIDLSFQNTRVEDLCLDFSLPGYPDYVFASCGNSKMVNISNLEEYVSLVVDATMRSGISRQLESFKSGFNKVFPIKALQIFTAKELERILCGEHDSWHLDELQNSVKFDHGYSSSSISAIMFLEIIQEFDAQQRRAFLCFVTGAPRLPRGGLAALQPKLTIVRKQCSGNVDMELPSVMTCVNYLKLPHYSSKELMREKLLYAIMEGQGAFHLS